MELLHSASPLDIEFYEDDDDVVAANEVPAPPENEAECRRHQQELAMRGFLASGRVCLHPGASCQLRDFFAAFDIYCRDTGMRPFKTAWKAVWNDHGLHVARRRGPRRLLGAQVSPSRGSQALTSNQMLAHVRATLGPSAYSEDGAGIAPPRVNAFPWRQDEP